MKTSRCFVALMVLSVASVAHAHTLRIITTYPVLEPGRSATVYLSWGHLLPVDELVRGDDLTAYDLHTPSNSVTPLQRHDRSLQANSVTFDQAGIYQVVAARKPATFTRYRDAEGKSVFVLKPKNEVELPNGATIADSAHSQQFAKAIILCGTGESTEPLPALGHPLEIVVETAPGPLGFCTESETEVRVLFQGQPLAEATIMASNPALNPDGAPALSTQTDANGIARLELFEPGTWVLAVHLQNPAPESKQEQYDHESYTATLSLPVNDPE